MNWPTFNEAAGAIIAGMLIGTTCYLLIVQIPVPDALWAADGGALGFYFRGRVEQAKP